MLLVAHADTYMYTLYLCTLLTTTHHTLYRSKGTLVICAVSLVGQWVDEAKRLCDNQLSIHPYHGSNRIRDPAKLAQYDIVVTTYGKSASFKQQQLIDRSL